MDNASQQSNGEGGGGVRVAKAIAIVVVIVVFLLVFIPNKFLKMQNQTGFDGDQFSCGDEVIEIWTMAGGMALRIRTSVREYELVYFGSTIASDHYRSEQGERAEYDAELKLLGFANGADGTCY